VSVVSDIRARAIALMNGSVAGLDRSIPAGRFEHEESTDENAPETESAPYPFKLESGEPRPLDKPATMYGSHRFEAKTLKVQVFYMFDPTGIEALEQTIEDDALTIWECLGDHSNWNAVANGEATWVEYEIIDVNLPTAMANNPPLRHRMLEARLSVLVREDHTS